MPTEATTATQNPIVRRIVETTRSDHDKRGELTKESIDAISLQVANLIKDERSKAPPQPDSSAAPDDRAQAILATSAEAEKGGIKPRRPVNEILFRGGPGINSRQSALLDRMDRNGASHELLSSDDYQKAFVRFMSSRGGDTIGDYLPKTITNVASAATFIDGGWTMVPIEFAAGVQRLLDKKLIFRQLARVETVTQAVRLGVRVQTKRTAAFAWGARCKRPDIDSPQGDVKELEPYLCTSGTGICGELIRKSAIDVEAFLQNELAVDMAEGQEQALWYGDGQQKPLGLLYPTALPSSQDVDITGGNITADLLIDMLMSLPLRYMMSDSLTWAMSVDLLKAITKLKSMDGAYIWSIDAFKGIEGTPLKSSLLGVPVMPSEFIVNSTKYPIVIGDFQHYWIAETPSVGVEREREASTDETFWYARNYVDGMPIRTDAFVRGKLP